jgi:hypothetical protein
MKRPLFTLFNSRVCNPRYPLKALTCLSGDRKIATHRDSKAATDAVPLCGNTSLKAGLIPGVDPSISAEF